MLRFLFDLISFRWHRRRVPAWAHQPDPLLPRLRPSYRWWVRW